MHKRPYRNYSAQKKY